MFLPKHRRNSRQHLVFQWIEKEQKYNVHKGMLGSTLAALGPQMGLS